MTDKSKPKRLVTHNEDFHTDDVFATALLLELFPSAEVIRSRDKDIIATGDIVYDVGGVYDAKLGRFDHHQAGASKRKNGITYSALGLLWQEYGQQYCDGDVDAAQIIDATLIMPIDADDNGQSITKSLFSDVQPFTIDTVTGILNPLDIVYPHETYDAQFTEAVELARKILRRMRDSARNTLAGQHLLLRAYQEADDKRVITVDQHVTLDGILRQMPKLLYLISPRVDTWGILAVSVEEGSFETRQSFPASWCAQSPDRLVEITGVDDVIFCHANGFFAVTKTRDGAVALARKALVEHT